MNLAHLHLLLNHFPTVGMVVGVGLFIVAFIAKSDELKRASLGVFFAIALLAIPAYMSGNAAEEVIVGQPDVSDTAIATHQDAALQAFLLMEITGAVAWLGLWQSRRFSKPTQSNLAAVLILSVLTVSLMARAAAIGGEIRHPELRPGQEAAASKEKKAPVDESTAGQPAEESPETTEHANAGR